MLISNKLGENGKIVLIDKNSVSDYLVNDLLEPGMDFMDDVIDDGPILLIITQIELLCWDSEDKPREKVNEFIEVSEILPISQEVVLKCVSIRKGKKIKLPGAIIAATAIVYKHTLITNNEKDFSKIEGLRI